MCIFQKSGFEQLRYRFRGFHGGCATLPADNESCQPTFVHHDETIDVTFFCGQISYVYRFFVWSFVANFSIMSMRYKINRLTATLKPQLNGPLYSNTVIGTLAVDGWAVTFGTARRTWSCCGPAQSPPCCTKCNNPCTRQRPIYKRHIIRCGTVIASEF